MYCFSLKKKAKHFAHSIQKNELLITADTIVILNDQVLNKPNDREEAIEMLQKLSSNKHTVLTGVCLLLNNQYHTFYSTTDVYFKKLSASEIEYYVETYKPFDKAGAYGIQEWIGYIGIERINGSYFNVMGLPLQRLYEELKKI